MIVRGDEKSRVAVLFCLFSWSFLLRSAASAEVRDERVIFSADAGSVYLQVLVLPRKEFTLDTLESIFRRCVGADGKNYMIIKVEVFVDAKDAWRNSKSGTDLTYELWASQYERYKKRLPAFAELLFMKGEAVMRVREANGRLHRKVLTENDPLELATEHYKFDLIHFQRSSRSRDAKTSLNFFLLGHAPLTVQQASEAAEELAKRFQSDDLTLNVRLDPWFIGSELFPVVYLFQKDSVARFSKGEYLLRPQVQCSLFDGAMHCK